MASTIVCSSNSSGIFVLVDHRDHKNFIADDYWKIGLSVEMPYHVRIFILRVGMTIRDLYTTKIKHENLVKKYNNELYGKIYTTR